MFELALTGKELSEIALRAAELLGFDETLDYYQVDSSRRKWKNKAWRQHLGRCKKLNLAGPFTHKGQPGYCGPDTRIDYERVVQVVRLYWRYEDPDFDTALHRLRFLTFDVATTDTRHLWFRDGTDMVLFYANLFAIAMLFIGNILRFMHCF